jgi:hypothetical protein
MAWASLKRETGKLAEQLTALTAAVAPWTPEQELEASRCRDDLVHFGRTHCCILHSSGDAGAWVPFDLWPAQQQAATELQTNREVVILKARQLGLTWLVLAFALQRLLFHPIQTVLLFSKRDDEAAELLDFRLRGMHERLPEWLRRGKLLTDKTHEIQLSNTSRVLAFSTTAGRSYTATVAVVDEADHVPDLQKMLAAVKPTIDAGGRLSLLSTADKAQPESTFKAIYRGAKLKQNSYHGIFLPWHARPDRTVEWYDEQRRTILAQTGSLDDLHQEYPATDVEALAARSLDKRIAPAWLQQCFAEAEPIDVPGAPAIPGLNVFAAPVGGRKYVVGADPAEGNPTSDDGALCVLDAETGEQAAELAGKYEPAVLASHAYKIALWYNRAGVLIERNNHGHACVLAFKDQAKGVTLLRGHDRKEGWLSSTLGKTKLYDQCADALKNGEAIVHSFATFSQLSSIDGTTLRAPDGQHDDRADAFALAVCARSARGITPLNHVVTEQAEAEVQREWAAEKRQEARPDDQLAAILRDIGDFPGAWREWGSSRCWMQE